jgi:hypothetical protein
LTPKQRLIPLSKAFISYLRADGIILPPESSVSTNTPTEDQDDGYSSEDSEPDPSTAWSETHTAIQNTIHELGGHVYPKLNWSAPKDATWIAANNSMECTSANDIYLLLKSSDFVTHDLEQAFADCTDDLPERVEADIPYHLSLRKAVPAMLTSMEFRCFVRRRRLVGLCQRDLNHYDFMAELVPTLQDLIYDFFNEKLKDTFPEESFVFDVYVPKPVPGGKVWLIDINPWAQRTDPLLFSWLELLNMPELEEEPELEGGFVRLSLRDGSVGAFATAVEGQQTIVMDEEESGDDDAEELPWLPEIRLVKRDDPETYTFNTPLYSAHKLPKDVVDAGMSGEGGIRDFLNRWEKIQADPDYSSDSGEETGVD